MKEFGSKEVLKYNMAMEKAVEVLKENNSAFKERIHED